MQQIKFLPKWLVCLLICVLTSTSVIRAQGPPVISYPETRRVYSRDNTITPLLISNTGGAIDTSPDGMVTTYAGNMPGFADGNFSTAKFYKPTGVTIDANSNVYVSDCFNHSIRKIDPVGNVTTFANIRGTRGAENGSDPRFYQPFSLVADPATGDVYVSDSYNNQIRKITPAGIASLFAGSPTLTTGAGDGIGSAARFKNPTGIIFDISGNSLLVTDTYNSTIRRIEKANAEVTTYSGLADDPLKYLDGPRVDARFNTPNALAIDAAGNIFIADYVNNRIRKINASTGLVTTYAGTGMPGNENGPRMQATFDHPTAIAVDHRGDVFVADNDNYIRKISATTGQVLPVAGNGQQGSANGLRWESSFFHPIGMAFDRLGNLFVADQDNHRIRKITFGGGYTIDKPLPAGLLFNSRTGEISGTPTVTSPSVTYTVTAHNNFGEAYTQITIAVIAPPVVTIDPVQLNACEGVEHTFTATVVGGGNNPVYQWQVNGTDAGGNLPEFKSTDLKDGDVVSCIVVNNDEGVPAVSQPAKSDPLVLATYATLSLVISGGLGSPPCPGTAITFRAVPSANTPSGSVYTWRVNGSAAGTGGDLFTSSSLTDGDVITCVMQASGACLADAEVTSNSIVVDILSRALCEVIIPTAFSPNGDGKNDVWTIPALTGYLNCEVEVFSRNGASVFKSKGYATAWDGTKKGKQLPVGVYYYVIAPSSDQKRLSGYVTIIR